MLMFLPPVDVALKQKIGLIEYQRASFTIGSVNSARRREADNAVRCAQHHQTTADDISITAGRRTHISGSDRGADRITLPVN